MSLKESSCQIQFKICNITIWYNVRFKLPDNLKRVMLYIQIKGKDHLEMNITILQITCSVHEEGRGVYRILVERPEWSSPLGRPRRSW